MTTIAFDGTHIAADTLISDNGCVYGYTSKIHQVKGGVLATSGGLVDITLAIDWFNAGRPAEAKPTLESFYAIFIPDVGQPQEYGERLVPLFVVIPWAGGSGRDFALSAMKLGKNCREAVEFAASIDLCTGGDIESIRVRD
ncbi:hypothetical protein [Enterobacter kobei]|uniref:hypothetical protein n=1 Tax=Enterobacter kobei TaxID=208224 RepID=UPI00129CC72D|nr:MULTISPECIES: hypothetical protein [Enterobacteriaceae]MCR2797936.1 hypothetical protein [Enterobacter kobei]WFW62076.1 hypothetical protein NFJ76_08995 [Citrobacter freundii]